MFSKAFIGQLLEFFDRRSTLFNQREGDLPYLISIVMTKKCLGQLAYIQNPKQLWKIFKLITNCTKKEIPNNFQKKTGWKYKANTVPKNTGIPGFCKNTVPYRTGIKFLIPLGPGAGARGRRCPPWLTAASPGPLLWTHSLLCPDGMLLFLKMSPLLI